MKPRFILFLDFDGVIKHKHQRELDRACVRRINDLARRTDAHIVISSSWRVVLSMTKLNKLFKDRIVGATPSLVSPDSTVTHIRHREALSFLKEREWLDVPWLALDDEDYHYPRTSPVHLTDSDDLITDADVEAIIHRVQKPTR
jgi:hypothetical protein